MILALPDDHLCQRRESCAGQEGRLAGRHRGRAPPWSPPVDLVCLAHWTQLQLFLDLLAARSACWLPVDRYLAATFRHLYTHLIGMLRPSRNDARWEPHQSVQVQSGRGQVTTWRPSRRTPSRWPTVCVDVLFGLQTSTTTNQPACPRAVSRLAGVSRQKENWSQETGL
ncbi:hypothetical protein BKA80DRAFT_4056 [Phyllosticta citrichinensis]